MTPKKFSRSLKQMVREMQSSSHELAGMLMDRCQTIESGMRHHIVTVDSAWNPEDLEGKTFGQLLQMFRSRCSDQELNEWLESLRQLRNDVAHTFFRDEKLLGAELGKEMAGILARQNHKVLRKGLRITEICFVGLKRLSRT